MSQAIGTIIHSRRSERKLSLADLGAKSGVSISHLARIESGERQPTAGVLRDLAPHLGFDEVELLTLGGYLTPVDVDQDDSVRVLTVGHRVVTAKGMGTITAIRVWHDLATLLGGPARALPVFDVRGEGWKEINSKIDDLKLWTKPPPRPRGRRTGMGNVERPRD